MALYARFTVVDDFKAAKPGKRLKTGIIINFNRLSGENTFSS